MNCRDSVILVFVCIYMAFAYGIATARKKVIAECKPVLDSEHVVILDATIGPNDPLIGHNFIPILLLEIGRQDQIRESSERGAGENCSGFYPMCGLTGARKVWLFTFREKIYTSACESFHGRGFAKISECDSDYKRLTDWRDSRGIERFYSIGHPSSLIEPQSSVGKLSEFFGPISLVFSLDGQFVRVRTTLFHLIELTPNYLPLKDAHHGNHHGEGRDYPVRSVRLRQEAYKPRLLYTSIGVVILTAGFFLIQFVTPFFLRNEEFPRAFLAFVFGLGMILFVGYVVAHFYRESITQLRIAQGIATLREKYRNQSTIAYYPSIHRTPLAVTECGVVDSLV